MRQPTPALKPPIHAPGPVTCTKCNGTAHLARSPATGRTLAVDDENNINKIHPCTLARPTAVVTAGPLAVSAAPLTIEGNAIAHVLGGRLEHPPDQLGEVTERLTRRGIVVLHRKPA